MKGLFSDYDTRVPPAGSPSIIVGHDINLINVKDLVSEQKYEDHSICNGKRSISNGNWSINFKVLYLHVS